MIVASQDILFIAYSHLFPALRLSFFCCLLIYLAVFKAGCDSKAAAPTADKVSKPRCSRALSAIACMCIRDVEALLVYVLNVSPIEAWYKLEAQPLTTNHTSMR